MMPGIASVVRASVCCVFVGCVVGSSIGGRLVAQIDLSDVLGGGDGTGTASPDIDGIDQRNGQLVTREVFDFVDENDPEADGFEASPVETDLIDSVFLVGRADGNDPLVPHEQLITQSGVTWELPGIDAAGRAFNIIFRNRGPGLTAPTAGGVAFPTFLLVPAASGVTFDLRALRAIHGVESTRCFSTVRGNAGGASGDAHLYVVLSDDDEVISVERTRFLGGCGAFFATEIPPEAEYLTLASGSNGSPSGDAGIFASAFLSAECPATPELTELVAEPGNVSISVGASAQITVKALDELGVRNERTAPETGTSYASNDAAVATVDAFGVVRGRSAGETTISVTNGALVTTTRIEIVDAIDLGNITAGGNGVTPPPEGIIGIRADTGQFVDRRVGGGIDPADPVNPQIVDGGEGADLSEFIDSVFILQDDLDQQISSTGVTFDFAPDDASRAWEAILNGRQPAGPDSLTFGDLGPFQRGVGCHSSQGITYDLAAIREEHGQESTRFFQCIAGDTSTLQGGSVNAYVIVSDSDEVLVSRSVLDRNNSGEAVEVEIPDDAEFLTLAIGSAGDGIGQDAGGFGLAQLTGRPLDREGLLRLTATASRSSIDIGESVLLEVRGILGAGSFEGATIRFDPSSLEIDVFGDALSVSDDGRITGLVSGRSLIRVTAAPGVSAIVNMTVGEVIDLSDVVRGLDGRNVTLSSAKGLDPRDGAFVRAEADEVLIDSGDAGPAPVDGSDFVDSVFLIGPTADDDLGTHAESITLSGVRFEFPASDAPGISNDFVRWLTAGPGCDGPRALAGRPFARGIGIHAAAGVSFDLDALRDRHGRELVGKFSTTWGAEACGGSARFYAILSSDRFGVLATRIFESSGDSSEMVEMEIPEFARYLTLAVGSDGAIEGDQGLLADSIIVPSDVGDEGTPFLRGDSNLDGAVDLSDAVFTLAGLFLGGTPSGCSAAANVNSDDVVNISDAIFLLDHLFFGGRPILPPFPECGGATLAVDNELGCEISSCF